MAKLPTLPGQRPEATGHRATGPQGHRPQGHSSPHYVTVGADFIARVALAKTQESDGDRVVRDEANAGTARLLAATSSRLLASPRQVLRSAASRKPRHRRAALSPLTFGETRVRFLSLQFRTGRRLIRSGASGVANRNDRPLLVHDSLFLLDEAEERIFGHFILETAFAPP